MTIKSLERERVRWACRRGMLELDLFLVPFFEKNYDNLSLHIKTQFTALLAENDPDIIAWLMDDKKPDNKDFIEIVEQIRQFRLHHGPHSLF